MNLIHHSNTDVTLFPHSTALIVNKRIADGLVLSHDVTTSCTLFEFFINWLDWLMSCYCCCCDHGGDYVFGIAAANGPITDFLHFERA